MIVPASARRILEIFVESYPVSAHYRGGRKLRKGGWNAIFPEIVKDSNAKHDFLRGVDFLVREKIVSVKWKRFREGDEAEALYLEDADEMYRLLGTDSPEEIRLKLLDTVKRKLTETVKIPTGSVTGRFLVPVFSMLETLLENRHPVPVSSLQELDDLAILLSYENYSTDKLTLRARSVRLFSDSKRLERLIPLADRLSLASVSEKLSTAAGLSRSYPEASFALNGKLHFSDGSVWPVNGRIVSLPETTILKIVSIEPDDAGAALSRRYSVLTVENKETFFICAEKFVAGRGCRQEAGFDCVVYTGGYPNQSVRLFLRKPAALENVRFCHYGDLDPDGLLIFQHIEASVGVPVEPFFMDTETYLRYLAYGYPIDEATLAKLDGVVSPPLRELARLIRERKTGVEQEVIEI